jgi:hypothetical protein
MLHTIPLHVVSNTSLFIPLFLTLFQNAPSTAQVIQDQRNQGRSEGEGGCGTAALSQTSQNRNLKNTDFVYIMTSKVLRYFPFMQNQPQKQADD